MRKQIHLDEDYLRLFEKVKLDLKVKKDNDVVKILLDEHEKKNQQRENEEEFIERMLNAYNQKYYALFERLKWSSQASEKNTTLLLDAINTLLIMQDVDQVILSDVVKAPVIQTSLNAYKDKIAHFKQKKDERNRNV